MREICGECKYHKVDRKKNALWRYEQVSWYCENERSENCGYRTVYEDTCDEWEERSK